MAVLVDNFQLTLYAAHGEAKDRKVVRLDDDEDNNCECSLLFFFLFCVMCTCRDHKL